jgi:hypothetical protein
MMASGSGQLAKDTRQDNGGGQEAAQALLYIMYIIGDRQEQVSFGAVPFVP